MLGTLSARELTARSGCTGPAASGAAAWLGWKTIGQRYIEEASRIWLAESAGAKVIAAETKVDR